MKEFVEKLIGRLEELTHDNPMVTNNYILRKDAIEIVNQLAEEYNNESVKGNLISRAEAIATIKTELSELDDYFPQERKGVKSALSRILSSINNQPTVRNDGWIPCSERLPEKTGFYLCTDIILDPEPVTVCLIYEKEKQHWIVPEDKTMIVHPIAWMEKPEPYKE